MPLGGLMLSAPWILAVEQPAQRQRFGRWCGGVMSVSLTRCGCVKREVFLPQGIERVLSVSIINLLPLKKRVIRSKGN